MTFDPSVPNANQSPGLFPPQNSTNFTRLKAIISGDHIFNDTQNVNTDGKHLQVTLLNRATPGSLPAGMNGILYSKTASSVTQLFFYNGITDYQLTPPVTPTVRILASVNFIGTGSSGTDQTIRSQYGVATVRKTSTGCYTVNFSTPMPDANYMVQATGMRDSDDASSGCVRGNATYSNSVTVNAVRVAFFGSSTSTQDVLMGNVTIFSVV